MPGLTTGVQVMLPVSCTEAALVAVAMAVLFIAVPEHLAAVLSVTALAATVTDPPCATLANVHDNFCVAPVPLIAQPPEPVVHVRLAPLGNVSLITTLLAVPGP